MDNRKVGVALVLTLVLLLAALVAPAAASTAVVTLGVCEDGNYIEGCDPADEMLGNVTVRFSRTNPYEHVTTYTSPTFPLGYAEAVLAQAPGTYYVQIMRRQGIRQPWQICHGDWHSITVGSQSLGLFACDPLGN